MRACTNTYQVALLLLQTVLLWSVVHFHKKLGVPTTDVPVEGSKILLKPLFVDVAYCCLEDQGAPVLLLITTAVASLSPASSHEPAYHRRRLPSATVSWSDYEGYQSSINKSLLYCTQHSTISYWKRSSLS